MYPSSRRPLLMDPISFHLHRSESQDIGWTEFTWLSKQPPYPGVFFRHFFATFWDTLWDTFWDILPGRPLVASLDIFLLLFGTLLWDTLLTLFGKLFLEQHFWETFFGTFHLVVKTASLSWWLRTIAWYLWFGSDGDNDHFSGYFQVVFQKVFYDVFGVKNFVV